MPVTDEERACDAAFEQGCRSLEAQVAQRAQRIHRTVNALEAEAQDASRSRLQEIAVEVDRLYEDLYAAVALATHGGYTADDVRYWCERSIEHGCIHPRFQSDRITEIVRMERVPNQRLREAFLARVGELREEHGAEWNRNRQETTGRIVSQVVARLATMEEQDDADYGSQKLIPARGKQLRRDLGIEAVQGGGGKTLAYLMPYHTAVAVASVLGLSPYEAGV